MWNDEQVNLLALAYELHNTQGISDHFSHEQSIELIMLAGLYHAVSFIVNGLKVPSEAFAPSFPPISKSGKLKR
jgi:hypothetical protein